MKWNDSWVVRGAFVFVSLLIVVLGFRIQQLKDLVDELRPHPRVGTWAPPYAMSTLDGQPVIFGKPRKRYQVFYFFNPNCPACKTAESQVAGLHRRISRQDGPAEMFGVSAAPAAALEAYRAEGRGELNRPGNPGGSLV